MLKALSLSILIAPICAGCGGTVEQEIDAGKTQIYVNNFKRGFGGEWLQEYKNGFEALHANDSYEEGKKGVQIIISNSDAPAETRMNTILNGREEVFFTEQTDYFTLLNAGILGDLTSAITGKLSAYGEERSIEDKFTEDQKNFLNVGGKYYAIPHYSGYFGLTYDVDLFDKNKLYFAKNPTATNPFIRDITDEKSYGPDGKTGVIDGINYSLDDGLPVTFDDFYALCDYMMRKNINPMLSTGQTAGYLNLLVNSIMTNIEGKDQVNKIYSCSGTMTHLAEVDHSGVVQPIADVELSTGNGYMSYSLEGRYDAIKFLETCYRIQPDRSSAYLDKKVNSTGYSVGDAHKDFLASVIDGEPVGMISEGNWWVNEASSIFEQLSDAYGSQYSLAERRLGFMPLPRKTASGAKNTLFDHLSAICFTRKNIDAWKLPLINDFIQYCHTDKALNQFSALTNTMKALSYELTSETLGKMNYFGRSLYNIQRQSDIVYPYNNSAFFQNNGAFYKYENQYFSKINGLNNRYVIQGLKDGCSAEDYFAGMRTYYEEDWRNRIR